MPVYLGGVSIVLAGLGFIAVSFGWDKLAMACFVGATVSLMLTVTLR